MPDEHPVSGSVYFCQPSKVAPAVFAALFFISGAWHLWQCIYYKSFKITALHPFCCLLFVVGFALREYGAFHISNVTIYLVSTICIYCAPPILELANYHVLGRILYYVPYFAPLHPGRTLTTFGAISGIVEILNALGVSLLANPNVKKQSTQDLGHILMKTALIVQIFVITVFVGIAGVFHHRCRKANIKSNKVQQPLLTLYISTVFIMIRTIYRTIEHFGMSRTPANPGADWDPMSLSPIVRYECNSFLWNGSHPRLYLPQDYHVYLAQDGKTELQGPGWESEQSWIMTFIDPCGLTALLAGKSSKGRKERPFWETNGFENVPRVKRDHGGSV
ncbi:RTA1 domain protein [Karstenula rhodostoma CBS 690.94]|uniref:RTA1 domain protein n=1 Tax=Karstenula rhodostoma CBS 690.94 TaxID=1392251 RepID=A0A9P4P842_9PLEO|nr:RTA1 domain protein [Karstenula rhodostoma CBS 690.94]